jgi:hypothetical protein
MVVIGEYLIKCPNCLTEVRLVAEMVSPVMVYCLGCDRAMIISNNVIFTLPFEYVSKLAHTYKIRHCGNVLSTQVSPVAKQLINKDKINELRELLDQKLDVQDFIKKIK